MKKDILPRFLLVTSLLAVMPLALSGCDTVDTQQDNLTVGNDNPPPTQDISETIPVLSDPQTQIWIPGYWTLYGGNFSWVPGKVMTRPTPTAVWTKARWMHHTYGWTFEEGHWD
jgi:hypothetical protein